MIPDKPRRKARPAPLPIELDLTEQLSQVNNKLHDMGFDTKLALKHIEPMDHSSQLPGHQTWQLINKTGHKLGPIANEGQMLARLRTIKDLLNLL